MSRSDPEAIETSTAKMSVEENPPQHTASNHSITPFRFFDSPLELRNEAYAHLFLQAHPIDCLHVWFPTTGRHQRRLAKENARNVFRVDLERRFWAIGEANLRCVRRLRLVASTAYYACRALLETVLIFVGGNVGEGTDVRVHDYYSVFLCEAVGRCFTKPFRRVRTKEGDGLSYKTRFDPENLTVPIGND